MALERPVRPALVAPWDLRLVLDTLVRSPFEPMTTPSERLFLFTLAICLVAIASARRVSELQAFLDYLPLWGFPGCRPGLSLLTGQAERSSHVGRGKGPIIAHTNVINDFHDDS